VACNTMKQFPQLIRLMRPLIDDSVLCMAQ